MHSHQVDALSDKGFFMTDDKPAQQEPSMEEILASIRRIVSDDGGAPAPEPIDFAIDTPAELPPAPSVPTGMKLSAENGIYQLTQEVIMVDPVEPEPAPPPPPPPPPPPEPEPEPAPPVVEEPPPPPPDDAIISEEAAAVTTDAFADLATKVEEERNYTSLGLMPLGDGTKTLEVMVIDLLRPMLREWLDGNLPPLVERLVQREIERMARRARDED